MPGRTAALVAVLVLAAGCSALPIGDGGENERAAEPTGTVSPVPVDQPGSAEDLGPTGTPVRALPPGVTPDGDVDRGRLADAHNASIRNRSYTWIVNERQILHRGDVATNFTRRVAVDGDRALVEECNSQGYHRTLFVVDGTGYMEYVAEAGAEPKYRTVDDPDEWSDVGTDSFIWTFLDREFDVSLVERGDGEYVRLHVPPGPPPAALVDARDGTSVWNYTTTVYVTRSGLARSLSVAYDSNSYYGEPRRIALDLEFRAVGTTTAAAPEWLHRAENATTPTAPPGTATDGGTATRTVTDTGNATAATN